MRLLRKPWPIPQGFVAPGFEPVRKAFEKNFAERGELGAACAAYVMGVPVVDLWGGWRDLGKTVAWDKDTLVLVFSATKGMAATAIALAHARGYLEFDARVCSYWPAFGQGGKERITVRQLMAHQAGLCALDARITPKLMGDLDGLAEAIATQRPAWEPGRKHGYHALSLGFFQGELLRRVDPGRRSLGRFFEEEIASKLGIEFYIGVPSTVGAERIAEVMNQRRTEFLMHPFSMPLGMMRAYMTKGSLTRRAMGNPRVTSPVGFNTPEFRAVEFPSGGGIGTVRGLARVYGAIASGGAELGMGKATFHELVAAPATPLEGDFDEVLRVKTSYSHGFLRPSRSFRFGTSERAMGAMGAGGAFGFADPDTGLGFAYAPNRMGMYLWNDPRERALREAVIRCVRRR